MKDFLGQEINAGDLIVYPQRHGSSLWMNKATVTSVNADTLSIESERTHFQDEKYRIKKSKLRCIDRVVVVKK